jgi:threonine-phosphate decarboxylase
LCRLLAPKLSSSKAGGMMSRKVARTPTGKHDFPSFHGGDIIATAKELGCSVDDLIDMSSNLTPLGPVPGLDEALIAGLREIRFLPENGSESLRELFAAKHGLRLPEVLAGNGTTEYIYGVPTALGLSRGLIVGPTYADYQTASSWAGMAVDFFVLRTEEDFVCDLSRLEEELRGNELVFLCNPNNPTGGLVPSAALYQLASDHPESTFLVDESYHSFLPERSLLDFPLLENLFVLGSFFEVIFGFWLIFKGVNFQQRDVLASGSV